jgi:hypothetical protein
VIHELVNIQTCVSNDLPQESFANVFSRMHGDDGRTAVLMTQENVASLLADDTKPKLFENAEDPPSGQGPQTGHRSDLNPLHSDELDALRGGPPRTDVCAYGLLNSLVQLVQGLRLGVASWKFGDGAHIPAILVSLDDHMVGADH